MTTGRVVVVKEYREPFVIEEYEVPDPEPGGLVLKITQAGICGSDLHTWRGDQVNVPLPESGRVMGHEGTGVVYQLGKGTTTDSNGLPLHEGDRIMYSAIKPCGNCYQCMRGEPNWCVQQPLQRSPATGPTSPAPTPTTTGSGPTTPFSRCRTSCLRLRARLGQLCDGHGHRGPAPRRRPRGRLRGHPGRYGGLGLNATAMAKDMGACTA